MNAFDAIGYLASLLVLGAFCMNDMRWLRLLAIASNFAFIAYGAMAGLGPVLLLHLVLLPVNLMRLSQSLFRSLSQSPSAALCTCHGPRRSRCHRQPVPSIRHSKRIA